jgi:hypothetical protein
MSNGPTKQRYEISICYTDKGGTKRYVNNVGALWFDGQRGNINLPPGVALTGGDHFINVDLPREQRQGGAQQQRRAQGGAGLDDDDDVPF